MNRRTWHTENMVSKLRRWIAPPEAVVVYLLLLGFALCVYTGFRGAFYIYYHPWFSGLGWTRILWSFVRGLRFDLSTLAATMGPVFLLLLLLPGPWMLGRARTFLLALALPLFWCSLFLFFIDLHYYAESGRRLSYEVFALSHDVEATLGIILPYTGSLMLWVLSCIVFSWAWMWLGRPRKSAPETRSDPYPSRVVAALSQGLYLLLFIAFSIIAGRGGLQVKPLRPSYAFANDSLILGHLALNPIFTVAHTVYQGEGVIPRYFPEEEALSTVRTLLDIPAPSLSNPRYPLMHASGTHLQGLPQRPNIVILLMESWGARFVGTLGAQASSTPYFDRLSREGVLFTNFYANGQRSIEGMSCLCCALPTFRDTMIIGGSLEANSMACVGQIFKSHGYGTIFMHGARTGSFGFDAFSRRAGFDRYIGMEDFILTKDEYDPVWGVYDDVSLMKANQEFRRMKEPFLALWFSLSSHAPFNLPPSWSRRPPPSLQNGELENTILYSDDSVKNFFEAARKEKYFNHTIFVILADHSAGTGYSGVRERFRIPFFIYAPGYSRGILSPRRVDSVGSQIDVLPTLLDLAGIRATHHSFGRSLFDSSPAPRAAILDNIPLYGWVRGRFLLIADSQKPLALYDYISDPLEQHNVLGTRAADAESMRRELYSFIQVSKTLILNNRLLPPLPLSIMGKVP